MFVQTALAAALVRADPRVAGLNFVGPEDYRVAREDYRDHMAVIGFLTKKTATESEVPVALHAGELWLGLVPPDDLTFHIREAVETAGAKRIGHGVALAFERRSDELLADDAQEEGRGRDQPHQQRRDPRRARQGSSADGVPRGERAGRALDRRCGGLAHRPHQRVFPRGARLPARLP